MVRHQHVGVDGASPARRVFRQALQIEAAVYIPEKTRHAIDAALYDVERYAGQL